MRQTDCLILLKQAKSNKKEQYRRHNGSIALPLIILCIGMVADLLDLVPKLKEVLKRTRFLRRIA